jgi:nitroimidazol reductase NimA-like FMN-containing flavoprotein (pyridoxamine 5'-phosphate oxidase superfamily)
MSVELSSDEAWAFLEAAHTGILTTLRQDGQPSCLPTWFVVLDRTIFVRARADAAKVRHLRRDHRACFLAESGMHWKELRAVMVPVQGAVVEDQDLRRTVFGELQLKYAGYRTPPGSMPARTRQFYSAERAVLQLRPCGKIISWDNGLLGVE